MRRLLLIVVSLFVACAAVLPAASAADDRSAEDKYEYLVRRGIFTGFDDGSARLNESMSREQFAAVLYRLWELEKPDRRPTYSDVLRTRWSFGEIEAVKAAGLMHGIGGGKFDPTGQVTVEQLAAVLVRGYGAGGQAADRVTGEVSRWAEQAVGVALRKGWIPVHADYTRAARRSLLVETAYAVYMDMHPASGDRAKPQLTAYKINADATVTLTFNEALDAASAADKANYRFDNGLQAASVSLSGDKRTVTITTERQMPNTVYRLTVRGVEDAAGNRMDERSDLYFLAVVDTSPPTITKLVSGTNTVVLTFDEKLDAAYAENHQYYVIDGGIGFPLRAVYNDAQQTVTLYTTEQTPGQLYSLTVIAVRDKAGNVIAPHTQRTFGGAGQPAADYSLTGVTAVNTNTLDVSFSKPLRDVDISRFHLALKGDNGRALNLSGWRYDVHRKPGSEHVLTVQFRSREANPELFRTGSVYTAEVSGLPGLNVYGDRNDRSFVGNGTANPDPYVTAVSVLSGTSIQVHFNEPVKNVSSSAFRVTDPEGKAVPIRSDNAGGAGKIVTSVVLELGAGVKAGTVYTMTFQDRITDAAGWNRLKTRTDGQPYQLTFTGVEPVNAPPRFESAYAVDRYTIELRFTEPVNGADRSVYRLYNESERKELPIGSEAASISVSADKRKATIHLFDGAAGPLKPDQVYRLSYRESGGAAITDLEGARLDASNGGGDVRFAGTDRENEQPYIVSAEATPATLRITMSETVTGFNGEVYYFEVTAGGRSIVPLSGKIDGRVITFDMPAMNAGDQGTIRISPDGEQAIRDVNRQKPSRSVISFTVK